MLLYLITILLPFGDKLLRMGFNTILFMIFFLFIWFKEKSDLVGLFNFRSKGK